MIVVKRALNQDPSHETNHQKKMIKKKTCKIDNFSNQQIAGIGEDQDFLSATTYLSDQVKNALESIKTKTKVVVVGGVLAHFSYVLSSRRKENGLVKNGRFPILGLLPLFQN